ncbi:hypothetical protein FOMPIDRAFT_1136300, partial [Fomitopsis schrenkii]
MLAKSHENVFISANGQKDHELHHIKRFLGTLKTPTFSSNQAKRRFIQKASKYFVKNSRMYKRNGELPPRGVIFEAKKRLEILTQAHE